MQPLTITLRTPHKRQEEFISSPAKRRVIRAGRRGGKTTGIAIFAVQEFLKGHRILYAAPTLEQVNKFWFEVCNTLEEPLAGNKERKPIYKKYENTHTITSRAPTTLIDGNVSKKLPKTAQIKAKTAWNADTLRGDWADVLILDEYQLMNEDTWDYVGAPMMLDTNGTAVFIYTPPSRRSKGLSKARDPRHASKLYKKALEDRTGRYAAFTFTSHDNPYLSKEALDELIYDMSDDAYHHEILAEDDDVESSWVVYSAFDYETQMKAPFAIPPEWPRYIGHDFGTANPAAMFFAQDPATGFIYAYMEYLPGPGLSTAEHVENFKDLTEGTNVVKCVGGSHQEEEIRQGYHAHGWKIHEPSLRKVNAQIDRVIGLMELNKLFVFSNLHNYHTELMNCLWERDDENRPTNRIENEAKYHLCAAARYILSEFVPTTAMPGEAPRTRATSYF